MDISFENSLGNPFQRYFKYHPDNSPEEGSFGQLSHAKMTEYDGICRAFYDPVEEYMERLGNSNGWSHLYYKD